MTAPTYYAAHPVRGGTVTEDTTWIGRCGLPDCTYWADHPSNLQTVTDAVAGHRWFEHGLDDHTDDHDDGPQPGPAAGEGDAAEHDVSPGVLSFEYRDPVAISQVVPGPDDDEALARRMVRGHRRLERRGTDPSPHPRDRQQGEP